MLYTQADVDALDAAFKSGAERVRLADGRQVDYRSVEEYQTLRRLMTSDIAEAAGTPVTRFVRVGFDHGVDP